MKGTMHFNVDATDEKITQIDGDVHLSDMTGADVLLLLHKFCEALHIGKEEVLMYLVAYDRINYAASEATTESIHIKDGAIKRAKEGLVDG